MTQEQQRITELEQLVEKLFARINELEAIVSYQSKRIEELEQENKQLKERLTKYETPKNSRNSSLPPSKDENRPRHTQSLREPSDKKPGGQPGHKGTTLEMTTTPNEIESHYPQEQCSCGEDLSDYPIRLKERRQVLDLPVIKPIITEHQQYEKVCKCGLHHVGVFPMDVSPGISYGTGVESLAAYLHARQFMPSERMREFFNDVLQVPISEGALHNAIGRMAEKARPEYEAINKELETSNVVGGDETGSSIGGLKGWFWTLQNKASTFIAASMNRGTATIQQFFPNGFPNAVLVHDCWKSYFETVAVTHQICIAHLLRELKYFIEKYKDPWSEDMRTLLLDALELKKTMTDPRASEILIIRKILNQRLDRLLQKKIPEEQKELKVFQKRLIRYKDYVFVFLDRMDVPADNNGSERAIRNIKVKHKISGYFKSMRGAEIFAILRSITDTALKRNQNVLASLHKIALS
jgi:transposase